MLVASRGDPTHIATATKFLRSLENTLHVMRGHIHSERELLETVRWGTLGVPRFRA